VPRKDEIRYRKGLGRIDYFSKREGKIKQVDRRKETRYIELS
jgi:hypothetical protein